MKFKVTVSKGNSKQVLVLHAPNEREVKVLTNQVIKGNADLTGYKFLHAIPQ